jgi:choline dehydrogenase-like flavoprotein
MLRDLSKAGAQKQSIRADVAVIGSGLAGLIMASRLRRRGCRVVVLESGGMTQRTERHPLNEVVQGAEFYRGAEEGRVRCLGGTSTRWGGAMLPFQPSDLGRHTAGWDIDWLISIEDLAQQFVEIERIFDLPEGRFEPEEQPQAASDKFSLRSAKWPTFRMRNVTHVLRRDIGDAGLEVWLNATATKFRLDEAGRLSDVRALSPNGNELTVEAPCFALAAGAIESTRLLLLMDFQNDNRIFAPDGVLGRYFFDHLSAPAATIAPNDRDALVSSFGLRFEAHGMRDCRVEPTHALRSELALPGAFAHVATVSPGHNEFTAMRSVYRAIQRNSGPPTRDIATLAYNIGPLVQLAWWRFIKRRLLPPREAIFELALVIEQLPHAENRITISPDRKDANGSPLAKIEWRIHEEDLQAFRTLQRALVEFWKVAFRSIGELSPTAIEVWRNRMLESSGIYHPGGSTRMGASPSRGVVDAELRTFRIPNLYVVSTSAFPSGGSANPSFMLMALALRAAERIAAEVQRRTV